MLEEEGTNGPLQRYFQGTAKNGDSAKQAYIHFIQVKLGEKSRCNMCYKGTNGPFQRYFQGPPSVVTGLLDSFCQLVVNMIF